MNERLILKNKTTLESWMKAQPHGTAPVQLLCSWLTVTFSKISPIPKWSIKTSQEEPGNLWASIVVLQMQNHLYHTLQNLTSPPQLDLRSVLGHEKLNWNVKRPVANRPTSCALRAQSTHQKPRNRVPAPKQVWGSPNTKAGGQYPLPGFPHVLTQGTKPCPALRGLMNKRLSKMKVKIIREFPNWNASAVKIEKCAKISGQNRWKVISHPKIYS